LKQEIFPSKDIKNFKYNFEEFLRKINKVMDKGFKTRTGVIEVIG